MSKDTPVASSSTPVYARPLNLPLSEKDLDEINAYLSTKTPQEILVWALEYLPGLHQTTAFGLTGVAATDMISKLKSSRRVPLIFVDTLYHFEETHRLVEDMRRRYDVDLHIYKPEGCKTTADFEAKYGQRLWETDENTYDYLVKVEPARRAYADLRVQSVITGRRASQGASRATLQALEVDGTGLLKLNPLCSWTFPFVDWYTKSNNVPRNALLAQGYKSVGDWHSTAKSGDGDEGERAGRWAGKKEKTECGLHSDYFALKAKASIKPEARLVGAV